MDLRIIIKIDFFTLNCQKPRKTYASAARSSRHRTTHTHTIRFNFYLFCAEPGYAALYAVWCSHASFSFWISCSSSSSSSSSYIFRVLVVRITLDWNRWSLSRRWFSPTNNTHETFLFGWTFTISTESLFSSHSLQPITVTVAAGLCTLCSICFAPMFFCSIFLFFFLFRFWFERRVDVVAYCSTNWTERKKNECRDVEERRRTRIHTILCGRRCLNVDLSSVCLFLNYYYSRLMCCIHMYFYIYDFLSWFIKASFQFDEKRFVEIGLCSFSSPKKTKKNKWEISSF